MSLHQSLNLNIDDYNRNELFVLFHLDVAAKADRSSFSHIRKIVASTHPDISGLPANIYHFFCAAQTRIKAIIESELAADVTAAPAAHYVPVSSSVQRPNLGNRSFAEWCSERDRANPELVAAMKDQRELFGYDKWLDSNEQMAASTSKEDVASYNAARLRELKTAMVLRNGRLDPVESSELAHDAKSLLPNDTTNYSRAATLNSGVRYCDIKEAHTKPDMTLLTPEEGGLNTRQTAEELRRTRDTQRLNVLSAKDVQRIEMEEKERIAEQARAIQYQDEERARAYKLWVTGRAR